MDARYHAERLDELERRLARVEAALGLAAMPLPPAAPPPAAAVPSRGPVAKPGSGPVPVPSVPPAADAEAAAARVLAAELTAALSGSAPPPAGAPWPEGQSAGPAPRPAAPAAATGSDWERFFGLTVLGRVGIGALLLAAVYFGQLGWAMLGPVARVALVYLGGGALIGLGAWLRPRVAARYTALLYAGGTALTYVGGCLATMYYDLVPPSAAVALLLASAALGQWLAVRLRLEAFAGVALAGAYAAPVLVGEPSAEPTRLFALLLVLHTWAAWCEHRWQWWRARAFAIVATLGLVCAWYMQTGAFGNWSLLGHVLVMVTAVTAPELLRAWRSEPLSRQRLAFVLLTWIVGHVAVLNLAGNLDGLYGFGPIDGAVLVALGACYVPRQGSLGRGFARLGGVLAVIGTLWACQNLLREPPEHLAWWLLAMLTAVGAALLGVRRWTQVGELGTGLAALFACAFCASSTEPTRRPQLVLALVLPALLLLLGRPTFAAIFALVVGSIASLLTLAEPGLPFTGPHGGWTVAALAVASGIGVVGCVVGAVRRRRAVRLTGVALLVALAAEWLWAAVRLSGAPADALGMPFVNLRFAAMFGMVAACIAGLLVTPRDDVPARATLGVLALALLYLGGLLEVVAWAGRLPTGWERVVPSLYTLVFAAVLLTVGFVRDRSALRWAGLVGLAGATAKVLAFDLANVAVPLRVLAAGAVGALLLLGAWAYARLRRSDTAPRAGADADDSRTS